MTISVKQTVFTFLRRISYFFSSIFSRSLLIILLLLRSSDYASLPEFFFRFFRGDMHQYYILDRWPSALCLYILLFFLFLITQGNRSKRYIPPPLPLFCVLSFFYAETPTHLSSSYCLSVISAKRTAIKSSSPT